MYSNYFGLREPSFSIAPDPHYLFLSEQHKEALAHLLYGAGEHGGFVLLTGEVGTGKTTVCRAFLEQLPASVDVALIVNPALTADELLRAICDEFRLQVPETEHSIKRLVDRLNDYLLAAHAAGRRPVLMIDEAQNLRPKVMEQVRLLTNLETTKDKLLQIFLIGQPELRRMLERESLRQINQRITARYHLRPLSVTETGNYIRHRVAVAGVERPLFSAGAIRRIQQVSGGVPRVINILCDRALLGACVNRANQVTTKVVNQAAREVKGEGLGTVSTPPARPAFAVAAALTLLLTSAWLLYERLGGGDLDRLVHSLNTARLPVVATAGGGAGRQGDSDHENRGVALPVSPGPAILAVATRVDDPAAAAIAPLIGATAPGPSATGPAAPANPVAVTSNDSPPAVLVSSPGPVTDVTAVPAAASPAIGVSEANALSPVGSVATALPRVSLAGGFPGAGADALIRAALPEEAALRVLLRRWGFTIHDLGAGDPCGRVAVLGLRCEREQGKLSHVRFYDRPVLMRVKDAGGARRYVVLGALDESNGTFDLPDGSESIPIAALDAVWTGDYTVVWQPPPTGATEIGPGAAEESIRWLRRTLSQVPGSTLTDNGSGRFDTALTTGLRQFQTARGLVADGIAGPRTLVQLGNAVALPGIPYLMSPTLAAAAAAQAAAAGAVPAVGMDVVAERPGKP